MKTIPSESSDITEEMQYIGSLSDKIKELEEQLQLGYTINGLSINTIVMEHLKKLNLAKSTSKNKSEPRTDKFSVSQSSYDCYRKIYFEMQFPRQANEDSLGRFAMGDIIDNIMKDVFESIGAKTGYECSCGKDYFDGKFRIQGESDADFSDLIVEVKSVSPFAWKYVADGKDYKTGNAIIGKSKIQHVRQLNTYMDIKGVKDGVLIYVNKDNFQLKTYPITHDRILMSQTVGRCTIVYNAIIEKRVPDKVKGKECLYCNYTDLCRGYP